MKKFKMTLLTLAAMLCLVFGMAFAVACGGEGGNEDKTEYYTLTLTYEKSQGTVTASAAASEKGYVKDETVTLTVTPAADYEVDSVKIGDAGLNAGADGKYSFKIGGNTTVTVTFKDAEKGPSENALLLDAKYYGTYHDMAEADKSPDLVINKNGVFWGENEVLLKEDIDEMGNYTVTVGDDTTPYAFKLNDDGTIFLFTFDTSVDLTFLKEGVTLSYSVTVTIVGDETWGTATLSPEKTTYEQGERVTLTVTPAAGYLLDFAMVGMDTASFDDDGKYEFTVTMDTEIFVYFKRDVVISEEFRGEWTNIADSADKLTLGDKTLTWAGHEVTVDSIDEYQSYDETTMEPVTLGINLTLTIDGTEGNIVTFYYSTSAVRVAWTDTTTWVEASYIFVHGDGKTASAELLSGSFTQLGGTAKLSVSETGHISVDNAELPMYFLRDELYGNTYYVLYQNAYHRLIINNDNYVTIEPADAEAADQTVLQFVRDEFTVTPYALIVGEWASESGQKITFKADGTVELTGKEGTTIRLLASDAEGTSTLVTSGNTSWEAALNPTFSESDGVYTLYFEYELNHDAMAVTFSKTLSKFTLPAAWQSGYIYSGDEPGVFINKFVVNETGLVPVDQFNNLIESQYAYTAATVSESEYIIVIPDPVYGSGAFYTLALNAEDKTITLTDSYGDSYVYAQGKVEPIKTFTVTLDYDFAQGSVSIAEGYPDDEGTVYTFAEPESGKTVNIVISVYPQSAYELLSIKVKDTELVYNEELFGYVYVADGSENVTVTITFREKQFEPFVVEDATLHGTTWSSAEYADKLTIDADGGVKLGDKVLYLVEESYNGFLVIIDGSQWTFITTEISDDMITLMDAETNMYAFTKDGGSSTTASYTVTVSCEAAEGTYSETMGTASVDKTTCSANDTVTVTVTVGSGYEIETVTANGETLTFTESGNGTFTYTYTVTEDTAIVVTFKVATSQDAPAA